MEENNAANPRSVISKPLHIFVMAMFLLVAALQTGCATMSSTPQPLKFDKFNLSTSCFSADDMQVIYRNRYIHDRVLSKKLFKTVTGMCPAKHPDADKGLPSAYMGPKGYFDAFEGPLAVKWRSLDGAQHSIVLDLDEIFKDRIVRHTEDPKRVDHDSSHYPVIVVEVNDRTVNLYMDVHVALNQTETEKRAMNRHRTLIYSKTM